MLIDHEGVDTSLLNLDIPPCGGWCMVYAQNRKGVDEMRMRRDDVTY